MVGSYEVSDYCYGNHSIDHTHHVEERKNTEPMDSMGYHSEHRQYDDVHFWMSKDSEEMLVENWVPS